MGYYDIQMLPWQGDKMFLNLDTIASSLLELYAHDFLMAIICSYYIHSSFYTKIWHICTRDNVNNKVTKPTSLWSHAITQMLWKCLSDTTRCYYTQKVCTLTHITIWGQWKGFELSKGHMLSKVPNNNAFLIWKYNHEPVFVALATELVENVI